MNTYVTIKPLNWAARSENKLMKHFIDTSGCCSIKAIMSFLTND